ncbi:MAG: 30S ribosomal protein S8 [Nanoarchaeota archaeon]|nr:30S ribosomal protein S8 [Nanoarchaeota archaeon]
MTMNDTLATAMSNLLNAEIIGKKECIIKPVSKVIKNILEIFKREGFIGEFKFIENGKGGFIEVILIGEINKCGVIKPRYSIAHNDFEKFEKRYLPAKDFGFIIVTTPKGIMTHNEAKDKGIGGRLLAFIY